MTAREKAIYEIATNLSIDEDSYTRSGVYARVAAEYIVDAILEAVREDIAQRQKLTP